jgi:predicted transcriptional regulator
MDMQRLQELREALDILMDNRIKGAPVIKQINALMKEIDRGKKEMKIKEVTF